MAEPSTTPAADEFELEVAVRVLKNGKPWTRQLTESMQMDQTLAVIGQHVVVDAVRAPLFKMGMAAAAAKDPEFMAKYSAVQAIIAG